MSLSLARPDLTIVFPDPQADLAVPPRKIGGHHQLLSGGLVVDTVAVKRSWHPRWVELTDAEYADLLALFEMPMTFVLTMPDGVTATVFFDSLDASVPICGLVNAAAVFLEA